MLGSSDEMGASGSPVAVSSDGTANSQLAIQSSAVEIRSDTDLNGNRFTHLPASISNNLMAIDVPRSVIPFDPCSYNTPLASI